MIRTTQLIAAVRSALGRLEESAVEDERDAERYRAMRMQAMMTAPTLDLDRGTYNAAWGVRMSFTRELMVRLSNTDVRYVVASEFDKAADNARADQRTNDDREAARDG